ncbi:Hypothetical_protein [Hexamita inflata]|uniref:Hypothetical_protein n=1 Tax=Hexamita inflata TaxID=28002 RepID=A0ABP1HH20_9EUKA
MSMLYNKSLFPSVFVNRVQFKHLIVQNNNKPESICDQIGEIKQPKSTVYSNSVIYPQLLQSFNIPNSSRIYSQCQNRSQPDHNILVTDVDYLTKYTTPKLKIKRNCYSGHNKFNQSLDQNIYVADQLGKQIQEVIFRTNKKMQKTLQK